MVSENIMKFSWREVLEEKKAIELLSELGYPSESDLKMVFNLGLLKTSH